MLSKAGNLGDSVGHWRPHFMFHVPKTGMRAGERRGRLVGVVRRRTSRRPRAGNHFHGTRFPLVRQHTRASSGTGSGHPDSFAVVQWPLLFFGFVLWRGLLGGRSRMLYRSCGFSRCRSLCNALRRSFRTWCRRSGTSCRSRLRRRLRFRSGRGSGRGLRMGNRLCFRCRMRGCCSLFSWSRGCCSLLSRSRGCCGLFNWSSRGCCLFSRSSRGCCLFSRSRRCCGLFSWSRRCCGLFNRSRRRDSRPRDIRLHSRRGLGGYGTTLQLRDACRRTSYSRMGRNPVID